jgi:parallel beta-helix repeat protein
MRTTRTRRALVERLEDRRMLATFYVSNLGNDTLDGSIGAPWATLQRAAEVVNPGDTVIVRAGTYAGFDLDRDGTAVGRIIFSAEPGVLIDARNARTPDGINLEGADFVTIEGFTVRGIERAGIRSVVNQGAIIRNNVCDQNGRWGIFTGFSENVLIENNQCSRSATEHGIYVSNSADNPTIRGNIVSENFAAGIHMNGDIFAGDGDGIISGAVVENNVVFDNGAGGGSGINCDGVQNSVFRNNLLYDNHASGIALYRIDGGGGSTGNVVINNTVVQAADARWAVNLADGSTGNVILNNILFNAQPIRGSVSVDLASIAGLMSDFNVVVDRFSTDGGDTRTSLDAWRNATNQDRNSIVATPAQLFVDPQTNNYQLRANSPALDHGTDFLAPNRDLVGQLRPVGPRMDIGAYERPSVALVSEANDLIYVRASGDRTQLEFFNTETPLGAPLATWPMSSTTPFVLDALGGNDRLIVDLPAGSAGPPGGIVYRGGRGSNELEVRSGQVRIDSDASGGALDTVVQGGAELITGRLMQNDVTLEINGKLTLLPGGEASVVTGLELRAGASFDLADNALVIDYTGVTPAAMVRVWLTSGRGGAGLGATWDGVGIRSSAAAQANAAEPESRSIGYAENGALPLGAYTTFHGVTVDQSTLLIAYARTGDANLDGFVDDDDVTVLSASYAPNQPGAVWANGDFDYTSRVGDDDVTLLGAFYSPGASAATSSGPPADRSQLIDFLATVIVQQQSDSPQDLGWKPWLGRPLYNSSS